MRRRLCSAFALLLAAPQPLLGYFEASSIGARAMALGDNFVSVADDASALYWNPAGLVQLSRHEALFLLDHTTDLDDVRRGFAAVALHTRVASFGVGWHAVHLADALREDLVYLSASRLLVHRALGAFISTGVTLKIAHVGVDADAGQGIAALSTSQTRVAADLGALLAPIPNVTVGINARNLGQPRFDLLPGGSSSELTHELEWGISLRWREDAQLHWSRVTHPRLDADNKLGVELEVGRNLSLQMGLARRRLAGGLGVRWRNWELESSFQAHDVLGVVTRVGVRFGFGAERDGLGGAYDDF